MKDEAEILSGGNASESVVRFGNTVRKPWLQNSATVQEYLKALHMAGVDVPKPLGKDHAGRHVTEYVEGVSAMDQLPLGQGDLVRVGRLIRRIHDASEGFSVPDTTGWNVLLPAENPNLMCHNDLAPWNLVMGERWVFIDWDAAAQAHVSGTSHMQRSPLECSLKATRFQLQPPGSALLSTVMGLTSSYGKRCPRPWERGRRPCTSC